MRGVSLHHHTTFSYMDGFGTPEQHAERSADLGMPAQAVTEHGNVSSHVRHEKACLKLGIKPVFGLEAYTAAGSMREDKNTKKWHMTLLAMNEQGYRNLMRLTTLSWAEGFYQWPTITGEMFAQHHEGLIVTSGCADSKLACDLLGGKGRKKGNEKDARRTMEAFKDLLGDRYFWRLRRSRNLIERMLSTSGMSRSLVARVYLCLLHRMCTILIQAITRCRSSYIRQVVEARQSSPQKRAGSTTSASPIRIQTSIGSSGFVEPVLVEQERIAHSQRLARLQTDATSRSPKRRT